MKPIQLQVKDSKGYYFSPGFYMGYWENVIEKYFPKEVIYSHVKLKPHRELWVGAILAASQTKINKIPYFVGLPADEPPDAEIVRFVPTITAKGSEGTNINKIGIEIVRCDIDAGETILGQILLKNKPAYKGMSVAVYTYGGDSYIDLNAVQNEVNALKVIHPHEIMLIAPVKRSKEQEFPLGTFAVTQFYPNTGQDIVSAQDEEAFFKEPAIRTVMSRGITRESKHLGEIELMPPDIKIARKKA